MTGDDWPTTGVTSTRTIMFVVVSTGTSVSFDSSEVNWDSICRLKQYIDWTPRYGPIIRELVYAAPAGVTVFRCIAERRPMQQASTYG